MASLREKIFCLVIVTLCSAKLFCQDTLYLYGREPIAIEALEISQEQIKYHIYDVMVPFDKYIKKNKVIAIKYKNGECDSFPLIEEVLQPKIKSIIPADTIYHGHFASVNIPSPIAPQITLNYEYKFKSGHFGLKIPVSVGFRLLKKNMIILAMHIMMNTEIIFITTYIN